MSPSVGLLGDYISVHKSLGKYIITQWEWKYVSHTPCGCFAPNSK